MWTAQTEGAKFWLQVMTDPKNRGVRDIFVACVDGLKGFPGAIEAVFPQTDVQLCIVHLMRHSLNYVRWKQRKEVAIPSGYPRWDTSGVLRIMRNQFSQGIGNIFMAYHHIYLNDVG